jgi:hypothetical protein
LLALFLLVFAGCGPEAKHDNPLDPVNGRGVWGTVYKSRGGGSVAGAVVTARPANINTVTDAQGAYQMDLPGGQKYILLVQHPQYRDTVDTVEVPDGGKLEHNFIIAGRPGISQPKVNTAVVRDTGGQYDRSLLLQCLGVHPEGQVYLKDYFIYAGISDNSYVSSVNVLDSFTRNYSWDLDLEMIYGSVSNPESLVVGKTVTFSIIPGDGSAPLQAMVPRFLSVPTNLSPNGVNFSLPGYLRWDNAALNLDITVEIWQGTQRLWSKQTAVADSVLCDASLNPGSYLWRVVCTDVSGNTAASEAAFIKP